MNLIETGYHEVNADGDPDLSARGVLAGAEEGFDSEVLFDPFEEEFDLPAAFVNGGNSEGWEVKVVGQEDESLSGRGVDVTDTSESFRVVEFSLPSAQADCLVAAQTSCLVDGSGFQNVEPSVAFGSNHKVCSGLFDAEQTGEVEVATVEDIDAARFEGELVEDVNIVNRPVCDAYKYWNRASQIDLSMQLDRCFRAPKVCPGKHRQAKVDRRGIDSVNHLVQTEPVRIFGIKSTGFANEDLSECFVNTPVSVLVGVGQIGPGNVPANAHRVTMCASPKAGFDISQALSEGDLREGHCEKLVAGCHTPAAPLHRMEQHAALKLLAIQQIENLSENETSGVHSLLRMNSANHRQRVQMRDTSFSSLAT